MRTAILILFLFAALACGGSKSAGKSRNRFEGTWIPISQELGGQALPAGMLEKQRLILSDSNYTFIAESVDKGVVKYEADKMDIYGREGVNKGKHFTAIYKIENEQLTICYNLTGDSYPTAFETKSKPGLFLSVFKRESAK